MKKELRKYNTDYYTYYNANPKNKHVGDCVIRAIAFALGQSWEETVRELTELGIKKGLVAIDKKLYPKYLESKGFTACKEPRDIYNNKMSVKDWIKSRNMNQGIIVANVGSHHVACIISGTVYDTWDSSNETMHKFWYKGE